MKVFSPQNVVQDQRPANIKDQHKRGSGWIVIDPEMTWFWDNCRTAVIHPERSIAPAVGLLRMLVEERPEMKLNGKLRVALVLALFLAFISAAQLPETSSAVLTSRHIPRPFVG
jgi:hypothetical protein